MSLQFRTWLLRVLASICITAVARAQFLEDFESCPVGNITNNGMPGCNGWQQYDGAPNSTSLVNTDVAYSGTQSVSIGAVLGGEVSDLVHKFTGYDSGRNSVRTWLYLPGPGAQPPLAPAFDNVYFLVLSKYQDFGPYDWSVQLTMLPAAGIWKIDAGSISTNSGPLVFDRWVSVRAEIDFTANLCEVFYDDVSCAPPYSWTGGVFGGGTGALNIAALQLYHSHATVAATGKAYWDDVRVRHAGTPQPVTYCNSKVTGNGCMPMIAHSGLSDAAAASGFVVRGSNFVNNKSCLLFYSLAGPASTPFQSGVLCAGVPIRRTIVRSTGGNPPPNDCSGAPSIDMNTFAQGGLGGSPDAGLKVPGNVVDCQWWGRDPGHAPPDNTQLSNALAYTVGHVAASGALFDDMAFNSVLVRLTNRTSFDHTAVLNGAILVSTAGAPNGSVLVSFDDGSSATITTTPSGGTFVQTGAGQLDLQTSGVGAGMVDLGLLNSSPVSLTAVVAQLDSDVSSGISPAFMSDAARAMLALETLGYTAEWNVNVAVARQLGGTVFALNGFWTKLAVWGSVTIVVIGGVAHVTASCASGTAGTFGALTVPCAGLTVGGALVGVPTMLPIFLAAWNL